MAIYLSNDEYSAYEIRDRIIDFVSQKANDTYNIVALTGGSCCGKSFYSKKISDSFGSDNITILHQDDFQLGDDFPEKNNTAYRWDDPRNFDPDYAAKTIANLSDGSTTKCPVFDLTLNKRVGEVEVSPNKYIIFDGIYVLHEQFLPYIQSSIYFEVPFYARFLRRIFRFTNEVDLNKGDVPVRHMIRRVFQAHEKFVAPQRELADIVVTLSYSFEKETAVKYTFRETSPVLKENNAQFVKDLPDDITILAGFSGSDTPHVEILWKDARIFSTQTDGEVIDKIGDIDWLAV